MDDRKLNRGHKWSGLGIALILAIQLTGMAVGRFNSLIFAATAIAVVIWVMEVIVRLLSDKRT